VATKKQYQEWAPEQAFLMPPSPMEWLPGDHLAYFILDVVKTLDLSAIESVIQRKDWRGTRPYSPWMMVSLLLYGYCTGVFSSRKLERATYENVAFRVIAGGNHPHFTRINEFRRVHLEALGELFKQVLKLCQRAGLVKLGHVSLDGTKVQANASKHKAMSYERMCEEEKRLAEEIAKLLAHAEAVDAQEDEKHGADVRGDELPEELTRRESRMARIQEAKASLEREAAEARAQLLEERARAQRQQAEASPEPAEQKRATARANQCEQQAQALRRKARNSDDSDQGDDPGDGSEPPAPPAASSRDERAGADALPRHRVPTDKDGAPKPKAQRNFTDPESRIMVRHKGFLQAYNAQIVADEASQIILAEGVSNQAPDQEYLRPMLVRTLQNCGQMPAKLSADAGYFSHANVQYCEQQDIDPYISPARKLDTAQAPSSTETTAPQSQEQQTRERMRLKLRTDQGRAIYARRKCIPEPVFGQIKEAMGFRRFSLRGLIKVSREWSFVCLCHNLLKLFRSPARAALAPL
jgi:transposase